MKKFEFPPDLEFRIRIQPPSGKHRTFRVIKLWNEPRDDGSKTETIADPTLTSINASLTKEKLSKEQARKEVELLVERLYREAGVKKFKVVSNTDNQMVLEQFWEDYYKRKVKDLVDKDSTYAKYRRAIEGIGELSVRSASADELQDAIDSKHSGNKQREIVTRLHTILRWLKRFDVKLVLDEEEEDEVRNLTRLELEAVLAYVEIPIFKTACRAARGTGARLGELIGAREELISKDGKTIFIKHQVRRADQKERTGKVSKLKAKKKNDPGRSVYILPEHRAHVKEWLKNKHQFTYEMRVNAANILRAACKAAFPHAPEKWLKFHNLRDAYAIELAQSGLSLLLISQQLGNSEAVCRKHYLGYCSTPESLELIDARVREAQKLRKGS